MQYRFFPIAWCNKTAATVESTPPERPRTTLSSCNFLILLPFPRRKHQVWNFEELLRFYKSFPAFWSIRRMENLVVLNCIRGFTFNFVSCKFYIMYSPILLHWQLWCYHYDSSKLGCFLKPLQRKILFLMKFKLALPYSLVSSRPLPLKWAIVSVTYG
jgi:hypothetical protein